ncbi:MAG: RES family NAD+ phosphorylase [Candidatus Puniceispirillaceae bacterium]
MQFNGPVWRLLPMTLANAPSTPAQAPVGRFHHSGQVAAYASLSIEGVEVAMRRYLDDGVKRALIPMWLKSDRVFDERGNPDASVVWQDIHASGDVSPTWAFSDAARNAGADAMLYSSRSRPELSHVVVFETACLSHIGPAIAFEPSKGFTGANEWQNTGIQP